MTTAARKPGQALAPDTPILTGLEGETLRAALWGEWTAENAELWEDGNEEGERIHAALISGGAYTGGGGAQPHFFLALAICAESLGAVTLRPRGAPGGFDSPPTIRVPAGLRVVWTPQATSPQGRRALPGYGLARVLDGQGWSGPAELWIDRAHIRATAPGGAR